MKTINIQPKFNRDIDVEKNIDSWIEGSKSVVRLNIDLPHDLHKKFKKYCMDQNITMTKQIYNLLEDLLR